MKRDRDGDCPASFPAERDAEIVDEPTSSISVPESRMPSTALLNSKTRRG